MIKVFNDVQEYNSYVQGGLISGDLYYVLDDGSVHFRTNNIEGTDKVYDKGDGGSEPEYTEIESTEGSVLIPCSEGDVIEVIGSNQNTAYGLAAFLDSNEEFIKQPMMWTSDDAITFYVIVDANNAASLVFTDTASGEFTARYRKIN